MGDIEETLIREIEKSRKLLTSAKQKLDEIKANSDLTNKLILLITDLGEKKDERIDDIAAAYLTILKTEKDISRIPWRFLGYLETHHLDLYRQVQTYKPQT